MILVDAYLDPFATRSLSVKIMFIYAVMVPLDAYVMDFVFSESEDGGLFDNKNDMDYHIPVFGGVSKESPMHIVHITVEMAPIAKASLQINYGWTKTNFYFESVKVLHIISVFVVCTTKNLGCL